VVKVFKHQIIKIIGAVNMVLTPEEKIWAKRNVAYYLEEYPKTISFLPTKLNTEEIDEIVYRAAKEIAPNTMFEVMKKCNELAQFLGITWERDTVKRQQAVGLCMYVVGRHTGGKTP
jgi:hypothetical protein